MTVVPTGVLFTAPGEFKRVGKNSLAALQPLCVDQIVHAEPAFFPDYQAGRFQDAQMLRNSRLTYAKQL